MLGVFGTELNLLTDSYIILFLQSVWADRQLVPSPFIELLAEALSYLHSINRHFISPPLSKTHRVGQTSSLVLRSAPGTGVTQPGFMNNGSTRSTGGKLMGKDHSLS